MMKHKKLECGTDYHPYTSTLLIIVFWYQKKKKNRIPGIRKSELCKKSFMSNPYGCDVCDEFKKKLEKLSIRGTNRLPDKICQGKLHPKLPYFIPNMYFLKNWTTEKKSRFQDRTWKLSDSYKTPLQRNA